jgi:hypothetical protein
MTQLPQVLAYGIILGMFYGLLTIGLALLFGVMKYLNIAHGSFMMIGGYASYWLFTLWHVDPIVSIPVVMVLMFLLGCVLYKVLFSSLSKASEDRRINSSLIMTFGLILILDNTATALWRTDIRTINASYSGVMLELLGVRLPVTGLIVVGLTILAIIALHLFLGRTYLGKSIRATAQDWEAARVAATRGHDVTLYEKSSGLGGLLDLATLIKGVEPDNLPALARYLRTQVSTLGVKTNLGTEVDSALIEEIEPDVVIVATGGTLAVPEIAGIDNRNVLTAPALKRRVKPFLRLLGPRMLGWLTKFWLPIGKKVVVFGSGVHGCEIAEFLIKRGREVTIVDTAEDFGDGMIDFRLGLFLGWLDKKGVITINGAKSLEITDEGVVVTTRDGETQTLYADSIIPTSPLKPNAALLESLEGKAPEVYAIGDCREPRMIVDAIADGWRIGNKI